MVGTIAPVVYRNSPLGKYAWVKSAAAYTLGSVVGGLVTGWILGVLGRSAPSSPHQGLLLYLISFLAFAYSLHEFGFITLPHPQIKQQVPEHWRRRFHPYITAALFGILLGTGFTTFIPTATYYIIGLVALVHRSPFLGALIFAIYGLTRSSLLWPLSRLATNFEMVELLTNYMDLTKPIMRQFNGFALAILSAFLIGTYL